MIFSVNKGGQAAKKQGSAQGTSLFAELAVQCPLLLSYSNL